MRYFAVCLLAFYASWSLYAQSSVAEPCFTDKVTQHLREVYPDGVPGRNLPNAELAAKTEIDLTYYVPVVVHVLQAGGRETLVTPAEIERQIAVMNEGFGRYGVGSNTNPASGKSNIRFVLAKTDPDGLPTPGYEFLLSTYTVNLNPLTQDTFMKRITTWDPKHYLNIWVVRSISSGLEGYTYLPQDVAGTVWDGLIIDHESFGVFPMGSATTLGYTTTHEAAHYFGLYHPWGLTEDECGNTTDYCDDTPPVEKIYFSQVPNCFAPFSCDSPLTRQVANYMDYSDDGCQNMFTQCQVDLMLHALITYRAELVSSENMLRTGIAYVLDTVPATDSVYVYPVPAGANLFVNVDFQSVGPARLELTDMTGRIVFRDPQASFGRGPIAIDVTQMSQGSYVLRITTDKVDLRRRVNIGGF